MTKQLANAGVVDKVVSAGSNLVFGIKNSFAKPTTGASNSSNPLLDMDLQMFGGKGGTGGNINPVDEPLPSRNGALNQAKRDANIPKSQQPDSVTNAPLRQAEYEGGHIIKNAEGNIINTREYNYTNLDGNKITIQDHGAGHIKGGQGPHFNVRPSENLRTGKIEGTLEHYLFNQ